MTPGQAAFEKFCELFPSEDWGTWADYRAKYQWEEIARAGMNAAVQGLLSAAGVTLDQVTETVIKAAGNDDERSRLQADAVGADAYPGAA